MPLGQHASGAGGSGATRFIGQCDCMRRLEADVAAVAPRLCTVLIQGESGVGKELAARQIHAHSNRGSGPFVPVDCTTLRDTLFESQLFGHVRGAFTGADRPTLGFFRSADRGTLFLDEIGELPLHVQAKLLRCIQDGAVVPLGAVAPIRVDVRIVAATHRDLAAMVRRGEFRQDLYYRLNVAALRVPPLRERREDIALIARQMIDDLAALYDEPAKALAPAAMDALLAHDWPGNVRELLNAIEHAFVFCNDRTIDRHHLPATVLTATAPEIGIDPALTLASFERNLIASVLRQTNGNQSLAAKKLGMERHRLHRRIVLYKLTDLTQPRPR